MSLRDYYLPLDPSIFESVVLLGIEPKMDGLGDARTHKHSNDGVPVWTVTVLTQRGTNIPEVELISLNADNATSEALAALPPMTPVVLNQLEAGKWTRPGSDATSWSFRCAAVVPIVKR